MDGTIHSVTEFSHLNELQDSLRKKLQESQKREAGKSDSLCATVLSLVVAENYERAQEELTAWVDLKTTFPAFQDRVQRLVKHCNEIIQAIQTKRDFPGLASLSLAKQQEMHEKVLQHFEDLKHNILHILQLEREHKLDDVRSTVWILRALCVCVALVFFVAVMQEMKSGGLVNLVRVVESFVDSGTEWLALKLNL